MTSSPAPPRQAVARATAWILLSAACFGSISIWTVLATDAGAALYNVVFWRYLLATPVLLAVAGSARLATIPRRRLAILVAVGGGGQGLITLLSLSSLRFIPVATLAFLFYTYPAWVALFSTLRGRERLDGRRLAALALSLAGLAVMVGPAAAAALHPAGPQHPAGALHPAGVALALAAAMVYGLFLPVIERLQAGVAPAAAAASVSAGAMVFSAGVALVAGVLSPDLPPRAWGAVAGLALVATTLAFFSFLRGLPVLGPVRTAIVSTVEPFWVALLGLVILGQRLTGWTFAGGALIAAAVILLHLAPDFASQS